MEPQGWTTRANNNRYNKGGMSRQRRPAKVYVQPHNNKGYIVKHKKKRVLRNGEAVYCGYDTGTKGWY